jgi:hypothetical protein
MIGLRGQERFVEAVGIVAFAVGASLAPRFRVFALLLACPLLCAFGLLMGGVSPRTVFLAVAGSFSMQCGYFATCALLHFGTSRVKKPRRVQV